MAADVVAESEELCGGRDWTGDDAVKSAVGKLCQRLSQAVSRFADGDHIDGAEALQIVEVAADTKPVLPQLQMPLHRLRDAALGQGMVESPPGKPPHFAVQRIGRVKLEGH